MTNVARCWWSILLCATAACADEAVKTSGTQIGTSPIAFQQQSTTRLDASGRFTPGTQVVITTVVTGIVSSERTRVRVFSDYAPFLPGRSARRVEHEHPLPARTEIIHRDSVIFAEPGYYTIIASTTALDSIDPRPVTARGAPLVELSASNLWILIEPQGGRADHDYDHRHGRNCKRLLRHGSAGAFYVPSPPFC